MRAGVPLSFFMARVFIHIGAHKTGSTFIQRFFTENSDVLRSKGLLYPKATREDMYGHHFLAAATERPDQYSTELQQLRTEIDDFQGDILLSSENLEYLCSNGIDFLLHSTFSGHDVFIIYYFRKWTPLLFSMWQESVKHGSRGSYWEFALTHLAFPFSSSLLNPSIVARRFAEKVGKPRFHAVSYDLAMTKNGVLAPLLDILELHDCPAPKELRVNESLSDLQIETVRALNGIISLRGYTAGIDVRQIYFSEAPSKEQLYWQHHINAVMETCRVKLPDLSNSKASQAAFADFVRDFPTRLAKDSSEVMNAVSAPSPTRTVVSSDYLLRAGALECLNNLADIIEKKISKEPTLTQQFFVR